MFSILIVDDNQFDREGIRDLVDWASLDIKVAGMASNGLDGYNKALELKPDFILTDVAMPLMDGIKMTEKIKEQLTQTKFIFMSCFDEFDYVKNAISLDVCDYVLKPIDLEELAKAIEKVKTLKAAEIENNTLQEELKAKVKESLPVLQEQLMRDLIHGRITDLEDLQHRMQYLGISYQNSFIIVLIQIDNYDLYYENVPVDDQYITIYSVKKFAGEAFLSNYQGYLLIQDTNAPKNSLILYKDVNNNIAYCIRVSTGSKPVQLQPNTVKLDNYVLLENKLVNSHKLVVAISKEEIGKRSRSTFSLIIPVFVFAIFFIIMASVVTSKRITIKLEQFINMMGNNNELLLNLDNLEVTGNVVCLSTNNRNIPLFKG